MSTSPSSSSSSSFNPRTPCGVRQKKTEQAAVIDTFQSTHSLRSATRWILTASFPVMFQSTHSLRSATAGQPGNGSLRVFQSTHSLRSATVRECSKRSPHGVSIHALLAECDRRGEGSDSRHGCFNPRTPCGVRLKSPAFTWKLWSFNPRTPCGVRPFFSFPFFSLSNVSIHALLAECDTSMRFMNTSVFSFNPRTPCGVRLLTARSTLRMKRFQSTHSLRSATVIPRLLGFDLVVSIHALLAECDPPHGWRTCPPSSFNPRTPCGVRPRCYHHQMQSELFQSTHSLRSATEGWPDVPGQDIVSIHALLAECDRGMFKNP